MCIANCIYRSDRPGGPHFANGKTPLFSEWMLLPGHYITSPSFPFLWLLSSSCDSEAQSALWFSLATHGWTAYPVVSTSSVVGHFPLPRNFPLSRIQSSLARIHLLTHHQHVPCVRCSPCWYAPTSPCARSVVFWWPCARVRVLCDCASRPRRLNNEFSDLESHLIHSLCILDSSTVSCRGNEPVSVQWGCKVPQLLSWSFCGKSEEEEEEEEFSWTPWWWCVKMRGRRGVVVLLCVGVWSMCVHWIRACVLALLFLLNWFEHVCCCCCCFCSTVDGYIAEGIIREG